MRPLAVEQRDGDVRDEDAEWQAPRGLRIEQIWAEQAGEKLEERAAALEMASGRVQHTKLAHEQRVGRARSFEAQARLCRR